MKIILDSLQTNIFNINNINRLVIMYYRTTSQQFTQNLINLIRDNNYLLKYNDVSNNISNMQLQSNQQINMNSNFMNYLYYNYQLLYDTIVNMNKINKIIPEQNTDDTIQTIIPKLNVRRKVFQINYK